MAAVVADATDKRGRSTKFVIGMQRPSARSYWKIPLLNRGLAPVTSEDPEVDRLIDICVNKKKTLVATFTYDALKLADVVVVDVQCDYLKNDLGDVRTGEADMIALEESLQVIAEKIPGRRARSDRDDGRPRHHRANRLPHHEEGVHEARHQNRSPARPQLRARDAGQELRRLHSRLLARVQRSESKSRANWWRSF